jgi:hypothetical protein
MSNKGAPLHIRQNPTKEVTNMWANILKVVQIEKEKQEIHHCIKIIINLC